MLTEILKIPWTKFANKNNTKIDNINLQMNNAQLKYRKLRDAFKSSNSNRDHFEFEMPDQFLFVCQTVTECQQ